MEHVKRCSRRGSDVLYSMGVLSITCVVHVAGAVHVHVRVCIYCSPLHACAYAGPSCTDVKRRDIRNTGGGGGKIKCESHC